MSCRPVARHCHAQHCTVVPRSNFLAAPHLDMLDIHGTLNGGWNPCSHTHTGAQSRHVARDRGTRAGNGSRFRILSQREPATMLRGACRQTMDEPSKRRWRPPLSLLFAEVRVLRRVSITSHSTRRFARIRCLCGVLLCVHTRDSLNRGTYILTMCVCAFTGENRETARRGDRHRPTDRQAHTNASHKHRDFHSAQSQFDASRGHARCPPSA